VGDRRPRRLGRAALRRHRRPARRTRTGRRASQLVHGDLTGNVLFHDELPPAIIDFVPYWRPTEYATAIVVTDAVLWENAPTELLNGVSAQYLLRALIFRGVTSLEFGTDWRPTLELARRIARCGSR
jgi:hypothetical protein